DSLVAREVVTSAVSVLYRINKTLAANAADAKVAFLSGQIPFLQSQLGSIQDSLEQFYTSNRSYENSPTLRFREQRLRSAYEAQLRLLMSVREQLASDELQARGVVQVVQQVTPIHIDPKPSRPLKNPALVLGAVLGALVGYRLGRQPEANRAT